MPMSARACTGMSMESSCSRLISLKAAAVAWYADTVGGLSPAAGVPPSCSLHEFKNASTASRCFRGLGVGLRSGPCTVQIIISMACSV